MRSIFIVLILIILNSTAFSQIGIGTRDSTLVADSLITPSEESAKTKDPADKPLKKPRRISPTADLRSIDGLFLGLAFKIQGIRALDSNTQKLSVLKSIRTKALVFDYKAEWISVFKNTDITLNGLADIRGNILNFFGRGNETEFDQSGDFRVYYRVNFSLFQIEPALRIRLPKAYAISVGPAFQHFVFNADDNPERYINNAAVANQYKYLQNEKSHAGLILNFSRDTRNSLRMPSRGVHFGLRLNGYRGLNSYSDEYAQVFPQFSFYKTLNPAGTIVLANRLGGGLTFGKTSFYQSAFLGSQENLLGYRKFRFAGDHLIYNNFETRVTLPNFLPVLRGEVGLIGFYDVGRVWVADEVSKAVHHGYGAGVFAIPFNRFFIRAIAGFSAEGMQATVALRQRF